MRVNSSSTGFFTNRLVVKSCIAIAMVFCLSEISVGGANCVPRGNETEDPLGRDREIWAKQANLFVRLIGHRLLMQSGDFTSRVLPVTEIKEGTFLLQFENQIVFSHDSLMLMAHALLPKAQFPSGYIVTVHDCITGSIVYGFQINNISPDNLACKGRSEPAGCYTIEIAFPDLYEDVEKKADIGHQKKENKLSKVEGRKVNPNPEELKSFNVGPSETNPKLADLKSFQPDHQKANRAPEEFKTASLDSSLINIVYTGMLVSLGVTLLIARFSKMSTPVPVRDQDAVIEDVTPELATLGRFLFDVKGQRLLARAVGVDNEVISLTDKECRILELLNESFGELIARETLMQKIWINEGVITGRSLDMFVSKLRKKLSSDPDLRITNVHGKGYKLEITSH
jgi:hypothetical protein